MSLIVHNGQAEVQRGFSMNKEFMKDIVSELTLVSRRSIKDYLRSSLLENNEVDITSKTVSLSCAKIFVLTIKTKEGANRSFVEKN